MEQEKTEVVIPKKRNWVAIRQVIFLIVILIAVLSLTSAIVTVHKYGKMLQNPVGYNINKFGLNFCSCYDFENKRIDIKSTNYSSIADIYLQKPEYKQNPFEFNTSQLNNSQ